MAANLPVEVLLIIFKDYVDNDPFESKLSRFLPTPPVSPFPYSPFQLMAVCSGWRSTALALPELWTNISIVEPNAQRIALLKVCLDKSGDLPLSLLVFLHDTPTSLCVEAMDLLRQHAHRWCHIDLRLTTALQCQTQILHGADLLLPKLKKATLVVHPYMDFKAEKFLGHLFTSRSLESLTWVALRENEEEDDEVPNTNTIISSVNVIIPSKFPWTRLREITLYSIMDMRILFDGLSMTKRLTHLCLDWHRIQPNALRIFSSSREVLLPQLVTFNIRCVPHPCIFNILRRFTTPNLREFELLGIKIPSNQLDGRWNTADILDFFKRSGCRLTKFSCRYSPTWDADNNPILLLKSENLAQVTHLTLDLPGISRQMVDSLIVYKGSTHIPNLTNLKLHRCQIKVSFDDVIKVARSRLGVRRLDVLDVSLRLPVSEEAKARIDELERAGTIVKYTVK